ncbi:MAG TPA: hypothetical protein VHV10_07285, partial [Ktedonobacteraceae bacterium]|nr:hypothetical protein [Ktedonobacteraceae bacterium]
TKTPGPTINATYSSTTRITQQTLVTTSPTSVLQKGIDVSIQATQNPNGTFTATSITLMQGDQHQGGQPDGRAGCFANNGPRQRSATGAGAPGGPSNKPTVLKPLSPSAGGQPDDRGCFGPTQKSGPANSSTQSSKQTSCRANGTVELLKGNILTITDRQHASHTITLTSGTNGTKIIRVAPATPSALKAGISITVMGPATKGVITALRITIGSLPNIPSF